MRSLIFSGLDSHQHGSCGAGINRTPALCDEA